MIGFRLKLSSTLKAGLGGTKPWRKFPTSSGCHRRRNDLKSAVASIKRIPRIAAAAPEPARVDSGRSAPWAAAETAIWLTEVAPQSVRGRRVLDYLAAANQDANPELMRVGLKLATGASKTTVMAPSKIPIWVAVSTLGKRA